MKFNIYISNQFFHHHAGSIASSHQDLINKIVDAINNKEVEFDLKKRKRKDQEYQGIASAKLNVEIRNLLIKSTPEILLEVYEEDGAYYPGTKQKGFDFAYIDIEHNILKIRNLCHGYRSYADGDTRWHKIINQKITKKTNAGQIQYINRVKEEAAKYNQEQKGKDIIEDRKNPIFLGEIQFGNWGLAFRDFFKVLKANIFTDVDMLIYIVADGKLFDLLSDNIVNFNDTKSFLQDNAKIVTTPTWVIGLDIAESAKSS